MKPIYIKLSEDLRFILNEKGIDPSEYKPAYGGESAGLDLYYTGKNEVVIDNTSLYEMSIGSKNKVLLPTGVHTALETDMVALILERGSISKSTLVKRAGVVDAGYTGEIFVNLVDIGTPMLAGENKVIHTSKTKIKPGDKLPVQLVVVPVNNNYNVVSDEEYESLIASASRKEGSVGSSDTEVTNE